MDRLDDGKLTQDNICEWVIENSKRFRAIFQQKFIEIRNIQNTMLINELRDRQSKRLLFDYLQNQEIQSQLRNQIKNDLILTRFEQCLSILPNGESMDSDAKFRHFMKIAERKCKSVSESLTLKKQYDILLQQASKCFKLKASETRHQPIKQESDVGTGKDQAFAQAWKVNLPDTEIETEFVCRFCQRSIINKAGLSMHQKVCVKYLLIQELKKGKIIEKGRPARRTRQSLKDKQVKIEEESGL